MRMARNIVVCCVLVLAIVAGCSHQQVTRTIISIKQALDSYNKARTQPLAIRTLINTDYKQKTNANRVHTEWSLMFNEATPAVFDGAMTFLQSQAVLGIVTVDLGMTYATWKHVKYLSEVVNGLDHTGQGGSSFSQRLQEYGTVSGMSAENLLDNSINAKKADHLNTDFTIDDGVASRGHRTNNYQPSFTKVGLGLFKGPNNKEYYGMTFAAGYTCTICS